MGIIIPRKIPHLLPTDTPVAKRYLDMVRDVAIRIEYDVQVGVGRPTTFDLSEAMQKMALDISRRRIDIVVHFPTMIYTVEVTRRAGLKAIGQLIAYPVLYKQTFTPTKKVVPLLVAAELGDDILPVLTEHKIQYILLP